jgi:hypothetical protein
MSAVIPPGFTRHPASGCIIPESEVTAHEAALDGRAVRHALMASNPSADALKADVAAQLAELAQLKSQLSEQLAATRAALAPAPSAPTTNEA